MFFTFILYNNYLDLHVPVLCLLWLLADGLQSRVEVRVKSASTFACEPSIKHVTFLPSPSSTAERTTYLFDFLSNPWTTPPVFPLRIVFMIQGVPVSKNSCLALILTFSSLPALPTMQIYFPVFFGSRQIQHDGAALQSTP